MVKPSFKSWAWLPLLVLLIGLLAVLVWLVTQHTQTKNMATASQGQVSASPESAPMAARDGKTEQITLISQKGSFPYSVEIASTEKSRAQGLSGRDGLAASSGMLFVFDQQGYDCFWMKDMKFDIDMLWFDQTQSLVHMQENAGKATYPDSFCPQMPASYVLEVPAGTVSRLGLQHGDHFTTSK